MLKMALLKMGFLNHFIPVSNNKQAKGSGRQESEPFERRTWPLLWPVLNFATEYVQ